MKTRKYKIFCFCLISIFFLMSVEVFGDVEATGKVQIQASKSDNGRVSFNLTVENDSVRGSFTYSDEDGSESSSGSIKYVELDGSYVWFAGKFDSGADELNGKWFFVLAHDGGKPGQNFDHIWIEWLSDGKEAKSKVDNFDRPKDNKKIFSGNIDISS